ncbi:aldo/keto reductase [Flaviaesturariibacter aridisoli]|uniref:Aldo/keto reductase n=1 Tax=Flaviaesturariibacter aridisoli TaxID=2545761 RepID=A0A4R4E7H5_9BACT|nr:aldo/keto reductase [Flaviaesturariibacter aridisoli]TCZ74863.1 aldo/keto reductase [Flaviaesturariibacter aridisoli]
MTLRPLGRSPFSVAPIALGTNVFGWTIDEARSFRILDAFVDAGFNLIDTADVYSTWKPGNSGGESETIIGRWLRQSGKRDRIVLATKVGGDMGQGGKSLKKEYIHRAVEDSLRRLQTDHIDLYQAHWDDETLSVGEPIEAFAELIEAGKVRAIGASNFSGERLREALVFSGQYGLPRYETFQPEYNLYNRERFEKEYAPLVQAEGLGVISYYALASGFLSGKYRKPEDAHKSARGGSVLQKYVNERGLRILAALDAVAERYQSSLTSVALAWTMAQPGITAPIASATEEEQLKEILQSVELQLDEAALRQLTGASAC